MSRSKNLRAAAARIEHAALLLSVINDYPDCIADLHAQADYLRAESIVEAQKEGLNVWLPKK